MRISKEIIEVSQNNSFCDLDGKENVKKIFILIYSLISKVMVRKFCKTDRVRQRDFRERRNLFNNKRDSEGNILTDDL